MKNPTFYSVIDIKWYIFQKHKNFSENGWLTTQIWYNSFCCWY